MIMNYASHVHWISSKHLTFVYPPQQQHPLFLYSITITYYKMPTNKTLQEQAQSHLPPNTLYIALYIRSDPPLPNDYHWAFYLHTPSHHRGGGGTKHDTDNSAGGWIPHHDPTAGILKTNFLCALVHVADIPEARIGRVEEIMRERDGDLNEIPGVTCRVWLLVILGRLVEEGLVVLQESTGGKVEAVEEDCKAWGNGFAGEAARNVQPRPVVRSRVCFG